MQSGSMELLTAINIVLSAYGGIDHFWGEKFPPKWLVCNTYVLPVFADVSHFARTYTGSKQYYLRSVAIPFINALKEQLETRFSRDDTSPIVALLQLVPRILSTKSTDDLVDKLLFYEDDQRVCGVK